MRLSKFLSTVSFITLFSLLYVYQQTEIFRLAYTGQKKLAMAQDLLDKNSLLRYNIGRSASLVCIGKKLSETADFQMPDKYRLVRVRSNQPSFRLNNQTVKKESLISRLFGIKREAVAKTTP